MNTHLHRLTPGEPADLAGRPTNGKAYHDDRKNAERRFHRLRKELIQWQRVLWAEGRQKLLIVLQAMDAGGKDGTSRALFQGVNPQGVNVTSFKVPSTRELAHDFLWRIHRDVPAAGMIGVFNRSQYEDVLVVRVHDLVPESVWRLRYRQINDFERLLSESGTRILKFYLHISKDEQRRRFQERIDQPDKNFKFSVDDLKKREEWSQYRAAYEEALTECSTEWAPWYIIPADQKWYRNLAIAEVVVATLEEMNPRFPTIDYDPQQVKID
ncbi:MAG: polyphosphate kinase 2 family protein [Planctomycetaceae bacterium]|nr:polyphosphate kinase 2 family protein [Planctomycetaceae bacterium]